MSAAKASGLPPELESLFWDCNFAEVSLERHQSFVIRRILDRGNWDTVQWLRRTVGNQTIREWLESRQGGGLDSRKLRLWGLLLDLPTAEVDEWVAKARCSIWERRRSR